MGVIYTVKGLLSKLRRGQWSYMYMYMYMYVSIDVIIWWLCPERVAACK